MSIHPLKFAVRLRPFFSSSSIALIFSHHPSLKVKSAITLHAITLLSNIIALREASIEGKDDVIFCIKGKVTEGATSNVFAVFDNSVLTTPESNQILSGITRKHVLSLLGSKGIETLEKDLSIQNLYEADEVWMTSSTKEIQPVKKIDDKELPSKSPKDSLWFDLLSSYLI
mgnify:CR=1 FL=1